MGTVVSNFDISQNNELSPTCTSTCSSNYRAKYSNFKYMLEDSYIDDDDEEDDEEEDDSGPVPPEPTPEPVKAEFEVYNDYYGYEMTMTAVGLPKQELESKEDCLKVGPNNRAWLYEDPDYEYGMFKHAYLGGSLEYDVDLSLLDCGCAAGLYLVDT